MTHHPHLHMIVPGGGISLDGTHWVHCRPGFLLPVRVLSRLFRRLFLTRLADAHAAGRLAFFGKLDGLRSRTAFAAYLAPLRKKNWFVYGKPPFAGPEAVLAYLARYTHRVAISNNRLIGLDDRGVTFGFKDYRRNGRARHCTMTLAPGEFIRRFLLHVLPKGFHRIRHYGLLASATCKATIARAKELIAAPVTEMDPSTEHDNADMATGASVDHRPPCPCCGGRMIIVESFGRGGQPRAPPSSQENRHTMTPVTALSYCPPAGEPRFRRRTAVASAPPKAPAPPSIMPKSPRRPLPRRQTRHRDRRSTANYTGQRIPHPTSRPVKSP